MAHPTKVKAIERLQKVLSEVSELKGLKHHSPAFKKWRRNAQVVITNTFGSESSHLEDFNKIRYSLIALTTGTPDSEFQAAYVRGLESARAILESMIEEINEYWEDEIEASQSSESHKNEQITTKEIFIVHGRDEGAREKVARFLERLDLKPVVLHEQPNEGRTIIAMLRTEFRPPCQRSCHSYKGLGNRGWIFPGYAPGLNTEKFAPADVG